MQFERALDRALTTLAYDAVTGADVARARDKVRRAIAETWNDPFETANSVGTAPAHVRSLHDIMACGDNVAAVTTGPVRDADQHTHTRGINDTGDHRPK